MQPFVIPVKGLKAGKSVWNWHADGQFFEEYGNQDVVSADIDVEAEVDNEEFSVDVKCTVKGTVTVVCDRCLDLLTLPVDTSFEEEDVLDLNQDVYDYVCTSLPLQRVHPEGGCNEETLKYLSK